VKSSGRFRDLRHCDRWSFCEADRFAVTWRFQQVPFFACTDVMGIRFHCPHCQDRLHVKSFLAGMRAVCPKCGAKLQIPNESELPEEDKETAESADEQQIAHSEATQSSAVRTVTLEAKSRTRSNGAAHPAPVAESTPRAEIPSSRVENRAAQAENLAPQSSTPSAHSQSPHVWYVRPPSGGQYGPAREDLMQRWIAEGRVTHDSLVWRDGWPEWRLASDALPDVQAPAALPVIPAVPAPPTFPAAAPKVIAAPAFPGDAPKVIPAPTFAGDGPQIVPGPATPAAASPTMMRYQKKKRAQRGLWTAAVIVLSILAITLIVTLIIVLRGGL
jgi:DNA-directed RNA polymerase subunit M/transcription elongation factor TFIIS